MYDCSVMSTDPELMKARLHQAFALFEAGVSMMRARLRREHPNAEGDEIERLLGEWLMTRPGAEHGDAVGRPRQLDPPG